MLAYIGILHMYIYMCIYIYIINITLRKKGRGREKQHYPQNPAMSLDVLPTKFKAEVYSKANFIIQVFLSHSKYFAK